MTPRLRSDAKIATEFTMIGEPQIIGTRPEAMSAADIAIGVVSGVALGVFFLAIMALVLITG